MKLKQAKNSSEHRVLFFSYSGIGNTILQTPTINALLERAEYKVDILFRSKAMAAVFKYDNRVNELLVLPSASLDRKKYCKTLNDRYDSIVTLFPSNRPNYHKIPYRIGASNRITHRYKNSKLKTRSFLSNLKIDLDESLHDVYQNLNLLKPFNIPVPANPKLTFSSAKENKIFADDFLEKHNIKGKQIVGIHPGCNGGQKYKRWSLDNFLEVGRSFNEKGVLPLFFFGPDDISIKDDFIERGAEFLYVDEKDLNNVACIIEQCKLFLTSDSGLGHIAVAMGTKSYAITGPAQPTRTAPFGGMGNVIHAGLPCSPCLRYPFKSMKSSITCVFRGEEQYKCLSDISPRTVLKIMNETP